MKELPPDLVAALERAAELYRRGRLGEAEKLCRESLAQRPTAPGYAILGGILNSDGRTKDAVDAYRRALALDPDDVMALNNLGRVLRQTGDLEGAIAMFEKAVRLAPDLMVARTQLAGALETAGRLKEAVKQAREAVRRHKAKAMPRVVLARALAASRRLAEAGAAIREALALEPNNLDVHVTKAMIETELGDSEAAVRSLRQALAIRPLPGLHSTYLMTLQYAASSSEDEIHGEHLRWRELYTKDITRRRAWPRIDFNPDRRLRVGFVSGDFRRSSTPFLLLGLLENRPREAWQLTCYDNSAGGDDMTRRVREQADHWRAVAGLSDAELAARVEADRIDVLFDLNGHTKGNRLLAFAAKPAPLQVAWLDYVATTGLDTMDYLFGDAVHTPLEEQRYFVERLRHLPVDYIRYWAPDYAPPVNPLPAAKNGYPTFGCFNSAQKISPPALLAWAAILSRLPGSRLILNDRKFVAAETRKRFAGLLSDLGVAADRIEFVSGSRSHAEFLRVYNRVDIALDSFPYSGGLTTCEALYMGVPVATFPGTRFCGRHSACHLAAAGLDDWIARDAPSFVDLAVRKAEGREALAALRPALRGRLAASPLMDGEALARGFTEALREIWREACAARAG
ncbi:MAG: tetratricopeptide repeat protein [Kiloniellales bacterium]|nr:tetratricopeptide repeat protein [Kiloniellales bacterium]